MEKQTYKVNRLLRHNGERYGQGDTVELTELEAKPLLSLEVVSPLNGELPVDEPPIDEPTSVVSPLNGELPVDEPPIDEPTSDDTVAQIVNLFNEWHGDGEPLDKKPNVDSVREALENQAITTEQRDEAWAIYTSGVG